MTAVVIPKSDPFNNPTSGSDYDEFLEGGFRGSSSDAAKHPFLDDLTGLQSIAGQLPAFHIQVADGEAKEVINNNLNTFTRNSVKYVWKGSQFVEVPANTIATEWDFANSRWCVNLEAASINSFLHSSNPANTAWQKLRAFTSGTVMGPAGFQVPKVVCSTIASSVNAIYQYSTIAAGGVRTISVFLKYEGWENYILTLRNTTATNRSACSLNLLTKTLKTADGVNSPLVGSISNPQWRLVEYPNGWVRVSCTFVPSGTEEDFGLWIQFANADVTSNVTGNGVDGFAMWAAQSEPTIVATSPIVTGAAPFTRAADVFILTNPFVNELSSTGKGALYINCSESIPLSSGNVSLLDLHGTNTNRIRLLRLTNGSLQGQCIVNNVTEGVTTRHIIRPDRPWASVFAFQQDSFRQSNSGGLIATDVSGSVAEFSSVRLGSGAVTRLYSAAVFKDPPQSNTLRSMSASSSGAPYKINVVLVGGQSNADGTQNNFNNNTGGSPSYLTFGRIENSLMWNGTELAPYQLGVYGPAGNGGRWDSVGNVINGAGNWGFAHVAVKLLADSLPNIVECRVTQGGTQLGISGSDNSWNADYASILGIKYLQELELRYMALQQFCVARDIEINPIALLWHQGEGDRMSPFDAAYMANFTGLVNKVRSFTEKPNLPIIYGTVPNQSTGASPVVRAAHLDFAEKDADAWCRDNNDLVFDVDPIHWNAASSVLFGTWAAQTYLKNY